MSLSKTMPNRKSEHKFGLADNQGRNDALRNRRMAHEEAQKAAGVWGEMSVGLIERNGTTFVHMWKGVSLTDVFKLAAKRPREISKPDHEALCAWLKAGRYEGFKHSISAWNVNAAEAERIKLEIISRLATDGGRVVNPPVV